MTDDSADASDLRSVSVLLESCTPDDLGVGEDGAAPELIGWCAAVLSVIAIDSSAVSLVVTGDFTQSVRDRTLSDYYRENYNVDRGAGTVGGKTMTLDDGSIAVLLPAAGFMTTDNEEGAEDRDYRETTIKRTALHEAHHVAMEQAGEGSSSYGGEPWARQNMLNAADSVISEYRAELGVAEFGGFPYQGWDYLEILDSLRSRIRLSDANYQSSLDVDALSIEVGIPAVETWRLFGYLAALLRQPEAGFHPVPPEWADDALWRDVVGEHWEPFTQVLERVPGGATRIDRAALNTVINDLADVLQAWLRHIGFHFHDTASGSRFDIVSRHLLD